MGPGRGLRASWGGFQQIASPSQPPAPAPLVQRAPEECWAKYHHPCLGSQSALTWEQEFFWGA